ncbi:MAG: PAS domain-containing protein [Deltaproteobacteria bacterium]|nr:PAS domain-containing protein [Deltaproteobacteria bacterium]
MSGFIKPMRVWWLVVSLVVFAALGTGAASQFLVRNEQKLKKREILSKGNYLTSIVALHSIEDFKGKNRENFLRTFREYLFAESLLYCLVYDDQEKPLLVLAPPGMESSIPEHIRIRSLNSMGLTTQSYSLKGLKYSIYEFSKPIFHGGEKTGTVRLGFKAPSISLTPPDRVSLLAMIGLFIFASGTFIYYAMAIALRPLSELYRTLGVHNHASEPLKSRSKKASGLLEIVGELEKSYFQVKETLKQAESEHAEITSRLGVANFEKYQMIKVIDALDFGVIITDTQHHINHMNTYMLNLLGKKREDAVGRSLNEVVSNPDIMSFVTRQKAIATVSQIEIELSDVAPDEMFQVSLSYIKDDEGSVNGKMILVKNITGEKSAEKTQHEFIANVAHEFLTPLTTINSYTEMLIDGEVNDKEMQKEFYNTINQEVNRLSDFIQNLLNMSKIEMGGLTLEKRFVKTEWLAADCVAAVEKAAQEKQITIEKNFPDNFPALLGDKDFLKIAIINLLSNAVKYTPENGQITFSISEKDGHVVFEVSDTGCGISDEELPLVFDKFYRSSDPYVAEQKGNGLGLAMTSEIIHLHGGSIEVKSEINKGSQFTIRLPKEEFYLGQQQ